MQRECTFKKFDRAQQIVYGLVYEPMKADSQGDWATAETIEKAAHRFTESGKVDQIDLNHDGRPSGARVVESFIARKGDPDFSAGAWAIGVRTPDDVWQLIEAGQLTGFSMLGDGRRVAKSLPHDPNGKAEIEDLDIEAVSLVRRAANKTTFAIKKSGNNDMNELLKSIAATMDKIAEVDRQLQAQARAMTDALQPRDRRNLTKAQAEIMSKRESEIAYELRLIDTAQRQIEASWEGEITGFNEATLRRKIAKSELRLAALGYRNSANINDRGRCVFFQRGGTSNFLQESASFPDDLFGISQSTRKLQKDAGDVDLDCLVI